MTQLNREGIEQDAMHQLLCGNAIQNGIKLHEPRSGVERVERRHWRAESWKHGSSCSSKGVFVWVTNVARDVR